MSTLKVNTVQHNTTGFNNVVQFTDGAGTENGTLCRAWVNFNGSGTVAIRADFNVNTVTDLGTGNYNINFSNALADANYSVCYTPLPSRTSIGTIGAGSLRSGSRSSTSVNLSSTSYNDSVFADFLDQNVTIFR